MAAWLNEVVVRAVALLSALTFFFSCIAGLVRDLVGQQLE